MISNKLLNDAVKRLNCKHWNLGLIDNGEAYFFDFDTKREYLELHFATFYMLIEWLKAICGGVSPENAYEDMVE